jgi:diguanylate cyclase (GGDEF)-like protein/PAS domain S-box-containing protein
MQRAEPRRARRGTADPSVAESEARHRALLAALPAGVVLTDGDGNVLTANPAACELLGIGSDRRTFGGPAEEERPDSPVPAPRRAAGSRPDDVAAPVRAAVRTGTVQRTAAVPHETDGRRAWLSVTAVPLLDDDGTARAVVSSIVDVTEDRERTLAAHRGEDQFRLTMLHSPIGFGVTALGGRFLRVNRRLCRMLGYRSDELQQRTLYDVIHPDDVETTSVAVGEMMRGESESVEVERRFLGHGGMMLWGTLAVTLVRDDAGRPLHHIVQVEDVSEVRKANDLVTHMTLHDPLTGLPNRTLVLDRIGKALARGRRTGRRVAVLLCDLDHFRVINDHAGHEQGDVVLVEVARRIQRALRGGDTAGRLGGDEFVVVCEDVADEREAIVVAERLATAIGAPLPVGDRALAPTASIGIAVSSSPDVDPTTLLRDADIASVRAKDTGRNRWDVVDVAMRRRATERLDIEHALRKALLGGDLRLHFQPIVDLTSRSAVGHEALLRWEHPDRGMLLPGAFLHVAEESGLIDDIGRWVLGEAARAAAASANRDGYVAINVSPHQVTRPGLADTVEKALTDAGLPPERLVVELTESVMLSTAPGARDEITRLDDLGVRIVVDDFGTGFSALSYLRDLPVSGIKVDRTFTAGLGRDEQSERIVEALTGLGRGLGVDVIVEGVETEEQRGALVSIGAEHAQGYLFGRPGPDFDGVAAVTA